MKLAQVQKELKAPKGQFNAFGKYKYRSCEDILEAIKPILNGEATITITDEIVSVGDRYYVKATATFEGEDKMSVSAFARESEDKKGMDTAQITGATSSYARKYALNGLFAIDDTRDADIQEGNNEIDQNKINTINSVDELKNYWEANKGLGKKFATAVKKRRTEIESSVSTKKQSATQLMKDEHEPIEQPKDLAEEIAKIFGGEITEEETPRAKMLKGMKTK